MSWTAVVLAGSRASGDPVAEYCGVPAKALAEVAGVPMLRRVVSALGVESGVANLCIVGDKAVLAPCLACINTPDAPLDILWCEPRESPAVSLTFAFRGISPDAMVLVTTGDHALLRGDWVRHFLERADSSGADLCLALVSAEQVRRELPETKRTVLKFSDLEACTCNLFAFRTPESRIVSEAWQRGESERKRPWRLLARLGMVNALSYVLGRLTLKSAFARLSTRFGLRIEPIVMPYALLAVDVDTPADLALCRRLADAGAG